MRGQRANTLEVINLMARKGTAQDLANCYILNKSLGLPYAQAGTGILLEMWRTLLSTGAMQLFLVEDRTRLVSSRVVAFRATVFITDEFCTEAQSMRRPYLAAELAKRKGQKVPSKTPAAKAPAGKGKSVGGKSGATKSSHSAKKKK